MKSNQRVRVLFLSHQDPGIGGAPKALIELIKELKKRHNIYPIVAVERKDLVYEYCTKNNIECYDLNYKDVTLSKRQKNIVVSLEVPIKKIRQRLLDEIALNKLKNKINIQSLDLIHSNVSTISLGALINEKYGIPHIVHLREALKYYTNKYVSIRNYISYLNERTTKFVAISNFVKNQWIRAGIPSEKVQLIYDGIALPKLYKNSILDKKIIRAVIVGTVEKRKGQEVVIDSIKYLSDEDKKRIQVDIIGSEINDEGETIKEKGQALPNGIVNFLGYKQDIDNQLKKYDIGIMASEGEPFGLVTVEYMAKGLLVLGADGGATPEIIEDKKTGLLFKKNDSKSLANILHKIIKAPTKFAKYGVYAQETVYKKYTAIVNADNIYRLYLSILNRSER